MLDCMRTFAKKTNISLESVTNGYVKLIKKKGDNPLKVHHPDDLYNHFYEFYDQKDSNGNGN